MKTETWKPMKYLAGLLALILVVTSMPVSVAASDTQDVTVYYDYPIITNAEANGMPGALPVSDSDADGGDAVEVTYANTNTSYKTYFQTTSDSFCQASFSRGGNLYSAHLKGVTLYNDGEYHLYPLVGWQNLTDHANWTDAKTSTNMALTVNGSYMKATGMPYAMTNGHLPYHTINVYLSMKIEGDYDENTDAYEKYYFDKFVIEVTYTLEGCTFEEATCGADATVTGTCTTCNYTGSKVVTARMASTRPDHAYSEYVSDDNGNAVATCTGCGATDTITDAPVFHSASISPKGNIAVNYYTKLPTSLLNSDATVTFTVDGDTTEIPVSEGTKVTLEGLPYYVFSCQVPAKQMTDTITATCGGVTAAEFSVRAYADIILNGSYSDGLKSLVTSMLHYGAYAQQHFGHNTGSLADAGLDAADLSSVTADALKDYASTSVGPDGAKFYGCSLILESETTLRFFFKVSEDAELTVNGGTLEVKTRGDYQYVDITNISAKDLGSPITLTVSDGANTAEVTASPLTYCYNVLSAGSAYDAKLVELVKSLYLYYVQAAVYFN